MQISTGYSATSLSFASQTGEAAFSTSARPTGALAPKDQIDMSDQALESSRKLAGGSAGAADMTLQLLGDVLRLILGGEVEKLEVTPDGEEADVSLATLDHTEASLSTGSVSLSLSGTIATKDGKELGFSLELQYDHSSFTAQSTHIQAGRDGFSLGYAGTAAELTSTTFSFTMSAAGENGPTRGKGSFHLNDEVSSIGKELKPLAKEFMAAIGAGGGWGKINRFLRSSA